MKSQERPYESLEQLLGYYYHQEQQFGKKQFWNDVILTISPYPLETDTFNIALISQLQTSEKFIVFVYHFLMKLPFKQSCQTILTYITQTVDPSYKLMKTMLSVLVPFLQEQQICLNQLNLSLAAINAIFSNQNPLNQNAYSHIHLAAPQQGITIEKSMKWPFEKGGTLAFWYNMSQNTRECKIFEMLNTTKCGFEIILKNKKIYIQKIEDAGKFRLIKNNSTYLCEAVYNKDVKLCLEFQLKKKFFQPYFSINIIMNNFVMNGVELDSFQINKNEFNIKIFKGFYGKFYSMLILTEKLGSQVQQINGQRGFIYEEDIRNFNYLFDEYIHTVLMLLSCARSHTSFTKKPFMKKIAEQNRSDVQLSDELQEQIDQNDFLYERPEHTKVYDAIRDFMGVIDHAGFSSKNFSIKKQIDNYGNFHSFLPFLDLLEINVCDDQIYTHSLNNYLNFIITIFRNKTDSIEQASKISYFKILASFFQRTKMCGFNYEAISKLKQIYLSLNSRPVRQKYFRDIVWGVNFPIYLSQQNFQTYIKFLRTFYNEDIDASISIFGISSILQFIRTQLDCLSCCFDHVDDFSTKKNSKNLIKKEIDFVKSQKQWNTIYQGIFEIIEDILIVERDQEKLRDLIQEFIAGVSFTVSPCYMENTLVFLENLFKKDLIIFKVFSECMIASTCDQYLCLFKALSCCTSEKVKSKIISFILKVFAPTLIDEAKKQKEMFSLCIKYHPSNYSNGYAKPSKKSIENRDSIEYSEDKLSLNSVSVDKFITISPIKNKEFHVRKGSQCENEDSSENSQNGFINLLDYVEVVKVISEWAFSEHMIESLPEEIENPGLFILMELYKGSTYEIRCEIVKTKVEKLGYIRFGPQIMAWAIQALMIGVFDSNDCKKSQKSLIQEVITNLLLLISNYKVQQQQQQTELSIIKLVFSSVKSKYPDQITSIAATKAFFMICNKILANFIDKLKEISQSLEEAEHGFQDEQDSEEFYKQKQSEYEKTCKKCIENSFTFMAEYFILKGDGEDIEYEEQLIEDIIEVHQQEAQLTLEISEKIFQILVMAAGHGDHKLIDQNYAQKNHNICDMLFREKSDRQKDEPKFLQLLFLALQNSFQSLEETNIEWRKKNLYLIKKYLVYMIQLTENSGTWKIQHFQEELKSIFLNALSFLEQKFSQYYYYPFQRHKNLNPALESRIRKNVEDLKRTLFTIFADLIELIQYIDSKGSMEHKSFYELMKPKRKAIHKFSLKNFYPITWKKVDEQIFQFMSLNKQKLKKEAQEKLESHLAQKRISVSTSNIEKASAKRLNNFIENEQRNADERQKKSISYYKMVESQKCKIFVECEEQITLFRLKVQEQQKIKQNRNREMIDKQNRQLFDIQSKIWTFNRTYEGLWANRLFYTFAQSKLFNFNNKLHQYYQKVRMNRFDDSFTLPFLQIKAVIKEKRSNKLGSQERVYANELFLEGQKLSKNLKPRGSERIKVGLQFLKRKVIDKLVKRVSNSNIKQSSGEKENKNQLKKGNILIQNVLWIKPMKVYPGVLKIQENRHKISFCHCERKDAEHLSLIKPELNKNQLLIKQWDLDQIQSYKTKRYLLKPTAIQIYFKYNRSIFFCLQNDEEKQLQNLINILEGYINQQYQNKGIKQEGFENWWEKIKKFDIEKDKNQSLKILTDKWMKYEISNLEYLMRLNEESGRTNCDLNQYPIFPWLFSKYSETKFKKNQEKYRDFSKNMGALGSQERLKKFIDNYRNIEESHQHEFPVPHHFGFHYSNLPTVLYYLIRVNPYSEGSKHLQGGKFDIPDRLFNSISDSFRNAISETSDVKELIPQFFYFPEFLVNYDNLDFGQTQLGNKKDNIERRVNHVDLPNGCMNAFDFIELHREALESQEVSKNMHKWIDLVFGYKNSGREAEKSINTFHYLTSQDNLQIFEKLPVENREALESQMSFYGKTPTQLFTTPHPQRLPPTIDPQPQQWKCQYFQIDVNKNLPCPQLQKQGDQEQERTRQKEQKIILFEKNIKNISDEQYIIVYESGKGVIFSLPQEIDSEIEKRRVKILKQFQINYRSYERIQVLNPNFCQSSNRMEIPAVSLFFEKIAIGGLFGGRVLVYSIQKNQYQILNKNSDTVLNLSASNSHQIMFSCSITGQLIKWRWTKKQQETQYSNIVSIGNKLFLHSKINCLKIDEQFKIAIACSESGCLFTICQELMEVIRCIKLEYPILNCVFMRYPYYLYYIECERNHQYCFSINGILLEESQLQEEDNMEAMTKSEISKIVFDGYRQRVLKLNHKSLEISVMAMPDFRIENKFVLQDSDPHIKSHVEEYHCPKMHIDNSNKKVLIVKNQMVSMWKH